MTLPLEQVRRHRLAAIKAQRALVKATDMGEMVKFGVVMTPTLAVDGEVKESGKVFSAEAIQASLAGNLRRKRV